MYADKKRARRAYTAAELAEFVGSRGTSSDSENPGFLRVNRVLTNYVVGSSCLLAGSDHGISWYSPGNCSHQRKPAFHASALSIRSAASHNNSNTPSCRFLVLVSWVRPWCYLVFGRNCSVAGGASREAQEARQNRINASEVRSVRPRASFAKERSLEKPLFRKLWTGSAEKLSERREFPGCLTRIE